MELKKLIQKYKANQLNSEELKRLQDLLATRSDEQVGQLMQEDWEKLPADYGQAFAAQTDAIWNKVDVQTQSKKVAFTEKPQTNGFARIFSYAAAVVIVCLSIATFYLYQQTQTVSDQLMVVQTGHGERVSMTLPDGTQVVLNSQTTLSYSPGHFDDKHREVKLEGEALFDVSHRDKLPFILHSDKMDLKVLGTKFNVRARKSDAYTEVKLLRGKVLLTSTVSNKKQLMRPDEIAILQRNNGDFQLEKSDMPLRAAWTTHEIDFRSKPLLEVMHELESVYGVTIQWMDTNAMQMDSFTGTLPTNDLKAAMQIVTSLYPIRARIDGKVVYIYKK